MNPWLLQMLAAARREDMIRAAATHNRYPGRWPSLPVRRLAGTWLIRAGEWVGGRSVESPRPRPVGSRPAGAAQTAVRPA